MKEYTDIKLRERRSAAAHPFMCAQISDQVGQVIKILFWSITGGIRKEKYVFNEKNINHITCSDPQAAETVNFYINMCKQQLVKVIDYLKLLTRLVF